jgi:hypothetical protein
VAESKIVRELLRATFARIDVERELCEACERPDAPEYGTPEYDEWRAAPEQSARDEAEQAVRLRVYAADERWQEAADAYYESCFVGSGVAS